MRKTWLGVIDLETAIRREEAARRLSEGNREKYQADPGCQLFQVDPPTAALANHPVAHVAMRELAADRHQVHCPPPRLRVGSEPSRRGVSEPFGQRFICDRYRGRGPGRPRAGDGLTRDYRF